VVCRTKCDGEVNTIEAENRRYEYPTSKAARDLKQSLRYASPEAQSTADDSPRISLVHASARVHHNFLEVSHHPVTILHFTSTMLLCKLYHAITSHTCTEC
jgi:hypothetical protein